MDKNFFMFLAADPSSREASGSAMAMPRQVRLRQGYAPTGRRGRPHTDERIRQ